MGRREGGAAEKQFEGDSIKKRSGKIGKTVCNENKIFVLGYFGSASKFWARFYGFGDGVGVKGGAA